MATARRPWSSTSAKPVDIDAVRFDAAGNCIVLVLDRYDLEGALGELGVGLGAPRPRQSN